MRFRCGGGEATWVAGVLTAPGTQGLTPHGANFSINGDKALLDLRLGRAAGGYDIRQLHSGFQFDKFRSDRHRNLIGFFSDCNFHMIDSNHQEFLILTGRTI